MKEYPLQSGSFIYFTIEHMCGQAKKKTIAYQQGHTALQDAARNFRNFTVHCSIGLKFRGEKDT